MATQKYLTRALNHYKLTTFGTLLGLVALSACQNETKLEGDGGAAGSAPVVDSATWHQDIAPIVTQKCVGCHASGGIGPFDLSSYESAKAVGGIMLAAVKNGSMPPWSAKSTEDCEMRHDFLNDPSLSELELAKLQAWVDNDMPEGDPKTAAALPEPPVLNLINPDASFKIGDAVTVEGGGKDSFECFSVDPGFTENKWISDIQIKAGNKKIVHHVLVFDDPNGDSAALGDANGRYSCFGGIGNVSDSGLLIAWAPGGDPLHTPANSAMELKAGSRLVFQVHYHPTPTGTEVDDSTAVEFIFAKETPLYKSQSFLIGNFGGPSDFSNSLAGGEGYGLQPGENDSGSDPEFLIPAGAADHSEQMKFLVPAAFSIPIPLWQVATHMHYVGVDERISITRKTPKASQPANECLIHTPVWDFAWQRGYSYDPTSVDYPTITGGDVITFDCRYNNTKDNPGVRQALADASKTEPEDVKLGEDTLSEMCLGLFSVLVPNL